MYHLVPRVLLGLMWAGQVMSKPESHAPKVTVVNGTYAGVHSREYEQDFFLGMPYAKTPERFTVASGLAQAWSGIHDAKLYPPHCIGYGSDHVGFEKSEDCLYINVIRPAGLDDTAGLPVAVWIHGGGLTTGGSADPRYNLSFIVNHSVEMGTPIIGVSFNYRLSAFGFLTGKEAMEEGITNIGFRDQRLALQWVQENIAAFGGSPEKVTIWGESAGAESVTAQMLAYNGRDDGLFRAAIGQSGFGAFLSRLTGGFNATKVGVQLYNDLVIATSCAGLVGSPESVDCLRKLPIEELNAILVNSGDLTWPPVLDGDFFQDYATTLLNKGKFVQVPLLVGTNTDEGASFGFRFSSFTDTDDEFAAMLSRILLAENTNRTPEALAEELMELYPNDQTVGIPSIERWPHIIVSGDPIGEQYGTQVRRVSALIGDYQMHYPRRRANHAWATHAVPSFAYRFNVVPNGVEDWQGSVHFQEVAFVMLNLDGHGYNVNPFGGDDEEYIAQAKNLSSMLSTAWVNFITVLDPNGAHGLPDGTMWPLYDAAGKVGQVIVWDLGESTIETDDWRTDGIAWFIDHALSVFGS